MTDALFAETGTVTFAGSDYSFNVRSFKETGGEKIRTFVRTMNRNYRRFTEPVSDWDISFQLSITGSEFDDLYNNVSSIGSVSLDFDGSYKVDYFNVYSVSVPKSAEANDILVATMKFRCTPYDSKGSENKVIT